MSLTLLLRDTTAEAVSWEASAHGWRLIALEGIHALRAAKVREDSLHDQLDALRSELRQVRGGCAGLNIHEANDLCYDGSSGDGATLDRE